MTKTYGPASPSRSRGQLRDATTRLAVFLLLAAIPQLPALAEDRTVAGVIVAIDARSNTIVFEHQVAGQTKERTLRFEPALVPASSLRCGPANLTYDADRRIVTAVEPSDDPAESYATRAYAIVDGDSLMVLRHGRPTRLRLAGIDAPEHGQPGGANAAQALRALLRGNEITVLPRGVDQDGRALADVKVEDALVNERLVQQGWAWHDRQHTANTTLARLEAEARNARRGLWADPAPTVPWDWRHLDELPPHTSIAEMRRAESNALVARPPQLHPSEPDKLAAAGPRAPPADESRETTETTAVVDADDLGATDQLTVYITQTGSKYHAAGCRHPAKSSQAVSLAFAIGRGLEPCGNCGGKPTPGEDMSGTPRAADLQDGGRQTVAAPSPSKMPAGGTSSSRSSSSSRSPSAQSSSGDRTPTGLQIHTGPRGGRYHISPKSGKKVYEKKR